MNNSTPTDTELLDWLEKEKPDVWYRMGFGVWSVSVEGLSNPNCPHYDSETLRGAIIAAKNDPNFGDY